MFNLNSSQAADQGFARWLSLATLRVAGLALLVVAIVGSLPAPKIEGATTVIQVGDFWFCSSAYQFGAVCPTTVAVGDTVEWDFTGSFPHTTTDCGPTDCDTGPFGGVWDSGTLVSGTFQHTFTQPGVYTYYCSIHPFDMRGEITVTAPVGGIAELPGTTNAAPLQTQESPGGITLTTVAAAAAASGIVLITLAAIAHRRWLS